MHHPTPPTPKALCLVFLKASGLALGDGYAAVQPLHKALVERNRWMEEEAFAESLATAQVMPGIFSINLAVNLGHRLYGWRGSLTALAGTTLPALVILLIFASFFEDLRRLPAVEGFLRGARPAIIALILLPCLQMWRRWSITLSTVWIPVGVAIGVGLLGVSPTFIILTFIALALLYGFLIHGNN